MMHDSEGRPFKMLVYRGSQKTRKTGQDNYNNKYMFDELPVNYKQNRTLPKSASRILQAPELRDDFYLNVLDWGRINNLLAVGLGSDLYIWNAGNKHVFKLLRTEQEHDYVSSLAWSHDDAKMLAVGYDWPEIQLWDCERLMPVRSLGPTHNERVTTLAWNGHILTSGSKDKFIINYDMRMKNSIVSHFEGHKAAVCGLDWSNRCNKLASGGNDNKVYIWDLSKMTSSSSTSTSSLPRRNNYLHRLRDHHACVKALAWSPHDDEILASGGGTEDSSIKTWNTTKGTCITTINTEAQVSGLEWSKHHNEILSSHGYSQNGHSNHLSLWNYPSMFKVGELNGHKSRILHLTQSPDGSTVASASADQTLRFWEIFGPPRPDNGRVSELHNILSFKVSPLR
ncbi:cell division cycle 20.5, cofactor of APC complex-like [Impatiens glandulifera]|uniref:cell division cycle 20.5, cofactor of APC complex-like n=1 Tax=Impatiens glandulifera TaxID=253017 RepID=UPI001FB0A8D3|nr:cell division cycle 20.5, cofactor of APC complex-like [Impatiens glandulifera]